MKTPNTLLANVLQQFGLIFARLGFGPRADDLSVSSSILMDELRGKNIAIVGNSRALGTQKYGRAIDSADLVIRINRAPMPAQVSHGHRTDWLALATTLTQAQASQLTPKRILWMSPKRKRLASWVAQGDGFYLHPLEKYQTLADLFGAPPTTGLMLIHMVAQSQAASISLYGFDFFASLSLTGRRTAAQVPHDFAAEKAFVDTLIDQDDRVKLFG